MSLLLQSLLAFAEQWSNGVAECWSIGKGWKSEYIATILTFFHPLFHPSTIPSLQLSTSHFFNHSIIAALMH
jgi:hypothetical protein